MLSRKPIADPDALEIATAAILRAAAEASPKARHRRRFAVTLAAEAERLAGGDNVLQLADTTPSMHAAARAEAGAAILAVLGGLPLALDRSPVAQLIHAGAAPLRPLASGAEAALCVEGPAAARERLTRALAAMEDMRERLLELAQDANDQLDRIDGDADLEDGGDTEPNLADAPFLVWNGQRVPDEAEADSADDEPWLAAPEGAQSYAGRVSGGRQDLEAAHDGREPSLGWGATVNQAADVLARGIGDDLEDQCEDGGGVWADTEDQRDLRWRP